MRYLARNTLIAGILELAESFGVDREEILAEIGLHPALAQGVGALVPSEAIIDAVEFAALRSGRSDFGLLLGARQDHRLLGPLGLLLEQASTIGELQAFSRRFFHLHNTALKYTLARRRNRGVMRLEIRARGAFEPRHYVEALFVICVRMAQIILGPKWRPLGVLFRHERLANRAAYERHFGGAVRFGQDIDALLCSAADFERRVEPRDPEVKRKLEAMLEELDLHYASDVAAKVAQLVRALLPAGQATVGQVSKLMALTPRTLQRRLRAQRSSFGAVLADTRLKMARDYLRGGAFTMTEIAPLLGYSEVSALSRFLQTRGPAARAAAKAPAKRRTPRRTRHPLTGSPAPASVKSRDSERA
jgi:AraC-like DNA-binding protein